MKSALRIIGGIAIGLVVVAGALLAYDWQGTLLTAKVTRQKIQAKMPHEWKLGSVELHTETESFTGFSGTYYYARAKDGNLTFSIIRVEPDEEKKPQIHWTAAGAYYKAWESDQPLRSDLPEPLGGAVKAAESIAKEMRKQKPWPLLLYPIGGMVSSVSARKLDIAGPVEFGGRIGVTQYCWGNNTSYQVSGTDVTKQNVFLKLSLRDGYTIVAKPSALMRFDDKRGVIYADEKLNVEKRVREVQDNLAAILITAEVMPGMQPEVISRLSQARKALDKVAFKREPVLSYADYDTAISPWDAKPNYENATVSKQDAGVWPAQINGINVEMVVEGRSTGRFKISRDGLTLELTPEKHRALISAKHNGIGGLQLHVIEEASYPALETQVAGISKKTIDETRKLAVDMLANREKWPKGVLNDDLKRCLDAVVDGRYYTSTSLASSDLACRLLAKGDDLVYQCAQQARTKADQNTKGMDVFIRKDSFTVYDGYSGSLLEVTGGEAKLRQIESCIAKGLRLNLEELDKLTVVIAAHKEIIPPELVPGQRLLEKFIAEAKLPEVEKVEAVGVPYWAASRYANSFAGKFVTGARFP